MDPIRDQPAGSVSAPPGPVQKRMPFLDVARAWALIGVVLINAGDMVTAADTPIGDLDPSIASETMHITVTTLFMGPSRALLAMMLGVGLVLMWRGATRRGHSPSWLLVRRYGTLFLVFGVAHFTLVTDGDILAPFSVAALVVIPLMPWLLRGAQWRPLVLAGAGALLGGALSVVVQANSIEPPFAIHNQGALGLMGFAVGIWLTRLAAFNATNTAEACTTAIRSRALRLAGWGVAITIIARVGELSTLGVDPQSSLMMVAITGHLVGNLGQALLYFGLLWWLVERARTAGRALIAFAPMGRMTLTIYFGSTIGFLLLMGPFEGQLTTPVQYGIGTAYFLAMALLCSVWLRYFRYGPAEWLWRCLTYMRPLPIVRHANRDSN